MSFKYVLDSSAWLEYLEGSERGARIHEIIEERTAAITILDFKGLENVIIL